MNLAIYRRARRPLFWIAVMAIYVAAIMPAPEAPTLGFADKADHIVAFVTLTLLARMSYGRLPPVRIMFGMMALGAAIELTQALPSIGRQASWLDLAADFAGIALAIPIASVLHRRLPILFE